MIPKSVDWESCPDLRLTVRLLPWAWTLKPWLYIDDVEGARGHWAFQWLAVTIEWWGPLRGDPMFPVKDQS